MQRKYYKEMTLVILLKLVALLLLWQFLLPHAANFKLTQQMLISHFMMR